MKTRRIKIWEDENGNIHRDIVWFGSYGVHKEGELYQLLNDITINDAPTSTYNNVEFSRNASGVITMNGYHNVEWLQTTDVARVVELPDQAKQTIIDNKTFFGLTNQGELDYDMISDDSISTTVSYIADEGYLQYGVGFRFNTEPGKQHDLLKLDGANIKTSPQEWLLQEDIKPDEVTFENILFEIDDEEYTGIKYVYSEASLYYKKNNNWIKVWQGDIPVFNIIVNASNVTGDESNPTTITSGGTATLKFTSNEDYELPDDVQVDGADYTWNID